MLQAAPCREVVKSGLSKAVVVGSYNRTTLGVGSPSPVIMASGAAWQVGKQATDHENFHTS